MMPPASWQLRCFARKKTRASYFLLVQQMLEQHGRPLALYHDRHGILKQTSKATETDTLEEQLAGKQDPTQFGRLLEELALTSIAARSRTGPKDGWNGSLAPYKIAWWSNCA